MRLTELMGLPPDAELRPLTRHYITMWSIMAEQAENSAKSDRSQPAGQYAHLIAGGKKLGRDNQQKEETEGES